MSLVEYYIMLCRFGELTVIMTSCKSSWDYKSQTGYQIFLICAMYALPLVLMGFTYMLIASTLWSNAIQVPGETGKFFSKIYYYFL